MTFHIGILQLSSDLQNKEEDEVSGISSSFKLFTYWCWNDWTDCPWVSRFSIRNTAFNCCINKTCVNGKNVFNNCSEKLENFFKQLRMLHFVISPISQTFTQTLVVSMSTFLYLLYSLFTLYNNRVVICKYIG